MTKRNNDEDLPNKTLKKFFENQSRKEKIDWSGISLVLIGWFIGVVTTLVLTNLIK